MRIYILRHEDRTMDATFFSPLTKDGLNSSVKLADVLKKESINKIYSSPFIRTLQTVYPYTQSTNRKVNLEYSLSEVQHPHIIPEKSYQVTLPEYIAESFNYNPKYISMLNPIDHVYPESEKDVETRVKNFIKKLIHTNYLTDNNILLVTHQIVCNIIIKFATKNIKNNINGNYPRGALSLVLDNTIWTFKTINWEILTTDSYKTESESQ
jgi:broad specificity phosphatase PhoE